MSAATFLTGLYPPAVRERWGADINHEVSTSGIRSWPDTLTGAARLWLHPGDWPETVAGQTRRVLTVTLFAIIAATGLVLRAATPSNTLTADVHQPVTSLWLAPLVLGIGLATPLPPLRRDALRRLIAATAGTLAAPGAAVAAMCALAWSGAVDHPAGLADVALVVYYWLTLGFVALRLCTLVARVARVAVLPTTRRLSTALLYTGTGLALATGQSVLAIARAGPRLDSVTEAITLSLLAVTAVTTGYDMRRADIHNLGTPSTPLVRPR